jgi:glycosyltransferase involved in cell wall biosynthesis
MKLYLSGQVRGVYRSQNIIKSLSDNGIPFVTLPSDFFMPDVNVWWLALTVRSLLLLFSLPFRLFLVANSTHVIVLPMNVSIIVLIEVVWAFLLRKRIIVDYYISFYDTIVNDRKTVKLGSLKAHFALLKDRLLLKISSDVIFLNGAESEYYQKVAGLDLADEKCHIIPLCADFKSEKFVSVNSKAEKNVSDALRVCWWGTYIPLHGLENIINAFALMPEENIELYLFGDSDEKAKPYRLLIEELGLIDNVFIENDVSFVNGKLAPFLIENCDLAIGNFGTSEKARTVLVNKIVDSLALGIPCLTMVTKATTELLRDKECVIFCEANPTSIAKNIARLSKDKSELKIIGDKGLDLYLQKFSPDSFRLNFMQVLKKH